MKTEDLIKRQNEEFETMCVLFRGIIAERYKGEELERMLGEFNADMEKVQQLAHEAERFSEECGEKWHKLLGDIERECEQGGITEKEVEETREFLESKGLLTDCTEDDEPQDSEPTGRKGSDIVRECKEAIENAFSDMLWDLCEHPARPSITIEVYEEKRRFLEVLTRFEEEYEKMEGGR